MVAVVGGAGYVGSHAVLALREAGEEVVVVDDFSTGHRGALLGGAAVEASVEDGPGLRACLASLRPDAVMHFAARIQVAEAEEKPALYWKTNVAGTANVAEAAALCGARAVVFSSSAAVYAASDAPLLEGAPLGPAGVYGRTKAAAEAALGDIANGAGLAWAALRYFNACGADPEGRLGEAHDPETHLLPLALRVAAGQGKLRVYGDDWPTEDGSCVRDYVHVSDLAAAHVAALRYLLDGGESGPMNLGTGKGTSVLGVVRAVEAATGRPVPWEAAPRRPGDPATLVADPALARSRLGWCPRYAGVEAAAAHQWAWMKANPGGYAG